MPGNKRGRGRAGKASRYRSATAGASAPRHQDNPQAVASQYLSRTTPSHGFSMGDAIKNTAKNRAASDKDGNLRSNPVRFVDAGIVEPLKELEEELCAISTVANTRRNGVVENLTVTTSATQQDSSHLPRSGTLLAKAHVTSDLQPLEEGSLFFVDTTGDRTISHRKVEHVHIPSPDSPQSDTDSGEDVVLFTGRKGVRSNERRPAVTDEITIQVEQVEEDMQQVTLEAPSVEPAPRNPSPPSPQPWQLRGHNDEDAIVADYIANMVDDDDDERSDDGTANQARHLPFVHRSLGGSDGEFDMGEDSDHDDSMSNYEQSDTDNPEAHNVEDSTFDGASDIDDETLARLLAKQEELGLDDEELVLFSADGYAGTIPAGSKKFRARQSNALNKRGKGKSKEREKTPSASAVADAFDGLDLMDWGRHNPPRKPKGQRGQPTFNVSDSELEATLEAVWQKDRLRKKEKKKEREELRAQGILGKHADPTDPRVKYPTHMTFDQIKEEMRDFLLGTEPSMFFPPMDPHARKVIHELANKFNIKSKSAGSGDQRRPALHRTMRTVNYREVYFEEVFARSGRKYFRRPDVKPRATRKNGESSGRPNRGGVNHSAFTYKDGEVVGGSAPELGESNKGRTMLEKMGWSTGMALGAVHNKGILQPVAHVVKRTKAGLG